MGRPEFVVLYRWRLKPGHEQQFVDAWIEATKTLRARGSRGSRLHRGDDDIWYGYAQWPSAEARQAAFSSPSEADDAGDRMDDAVAERFPEVVLEVVSDYLID